MAKKSKYGWTFHAENHAKKNNKTNYLHLPSTSITALSFFFFSGIPCFCALCANICDAETERYSSKKIIIFCVFAGHSQYKMTATATAATNIRWLHCIFHLTGDQWLFAIVYYCVSVQQQTLCNCVVCIVPVTLSFIHVPNRSQKYNFLVSSSNNAIGSLCAGQKLIVHHRNTEQLACFFFFFGYFLHLLSSKRIHRDLWPTREKNMIERQWAHSFRTFAKLLRGLMALPSISVTVSANTHFQF